jgi:tRNA A64-2'-O-ribosylphosphate transferase
MRTSEDELPTLIEGLVQQVGNSLASSPEVTRILPTSNIHIAAGSLYDINKFDLIVNCEGEKQGSASRVLHLNCRPGKLGSKDLRGKLPIAVSAVSNRLQRHPESKIMITCATGKDFSIGVAVAILCLLYNDQGEIVPPLFRGYD